MMSRPRYVLLLYTPKCSSCSSRSSSPLAEPCKRCCYAEIMALIQDEGVIETPSTETNHATPTLSTNVCYGNIYLRWSETPQAGVTDILDELFVDSNLLRYLNQKRAVNWCQSMRTLYPLKTKGDGNCLLHAVCLAMWGVPDNLLLRRLLYVALVQAGDDQFKARWINERTWLNDQVPDGGLQYSLREWEEEWSNIVRAAEDHRKTTSSWTYELPYESLEEIHIFVLANIVRRPIIVVGDPLIHSPYDGDVIGNNNFIGVYLPLLWPAEYCVNSPIVLGFVLDHFVPLVCKDPPKFPSRRRFGGGTQLSILDSTKTFEHVDPQMSGSNTKESHAIQSENTTPTGRTARVRRPGRSQIPGYNQCVPLVTHDLQPLRVHFMLPSDADDTDSLLRKYLNVVDIPHWMSFDDEVQTAGETTRGHCSSTSTSAHVEQRGADVPVYQGRRGLGNDVPITATKLTNQTDGGVSISTSAQLTNKCERNRQEDITTHVTDDTEPTLKTTPQAVPASTADSNIPSHSTRSLHSMDSDDDESNTDDPTMIPVAIPAAYIIYHFVDEDFDYISQMAYFVKTYSMFSKSHKRLTVMLGASYLLRWVWRKEMMRSKRAAIVKLHDAWWSAANTWQGKTLIYARYW